MKPQDRARALRPMIEKASASLDDGDALDAVELFPAWQTDTAYALDFRVRYDGTLYKCVQVHTSQADWTPDMTPALWTIVAKPSQGDTPDNPIPWEWGLEIYNNKYYLENDITYIGIRNSDIAIFADLSALVGNYVDVYKEE